LPACHHATGEKEVNRMTSAGEVIHLPVPSLGRIMLPSINMERQPARNRQQSCHHRVYRLPRNDPQRFIYAANGYRVSQKIVGKNIDIYA
jgi:hypothetical protein